MPDVNAIAAVIYKRASRGTPLNPGVPKKLAELIARQAAHETGGFKSNAWKMDNNAFGYKWVGSRYQIGRGIQSSEGDFYGRYADYMDSVDEVVDWIYRRKAQGLFPDLATITTAEQYSTLLKNAGYYGDSVDNYTKGLKRWALSLAVKGTAIASVVGLGIAIWAVIKIAKWTK